MNRDPRTVIIRPVVSEKSFVLAEAGTAQLREAVEVLGLIFFDREEEGVARRPAVRIAVDDSSR